MSQYGLEYEHHTYCVERAKKPSRRIFDTFRHNLPLLAQVPPGSTILDIASGIGENGHDLQWLGMRTISLDISLHAQNLGQKVFGNEKNNKRLVGDAIKLPFKDNSFDFATSYDLLEHLVPNDIENTLDELSRVVKGNRIFVKITPTEDTRNIDIDDTHITKWKQSIWKDFFLSNGWSTQGDMTRKLFGKTIHGNFLLEKV